MRENHTFTLFLVLLFALLLPATDAFAEREKPTSRDTVFVLDRSMFSDKDTLSETSEAIRGLSREILMSRPEGRIAVVTYNDHAEVTLPFTQDYERIQSALKGLVPFGFSNPQAAIEHAAALRSDGNLDIVLVPSSHPTIGPITAHGPYGPKDHFYFRNANALIQAKEGLPENCRIFTLGQFSKRNHRDYYFANRLYRELSNGYWQNLDDAALRELKQNLLDGRDVQKTRGEQKPIVFIPGIAGSELFVTDESRLDSLEQATGLIKSSRLSESNRLWLPFGYDSKKVNRDLAIESNLFGLQEGNLQRSSLLDSHSGPMALYGSLLDSLRRAFPDRPIYLFSYDWRQPNALTARKLDAFINSINQGGNVKVDLVAHSMGGLVSAHYLEDHDEKVDKYLSFGTPYEGAPKAYNEMNNRHILGGFIDTMLNGMFGIRLDIVQDFDSLVELYPTRKLMEKYPYQVVHHPAQLDLEVAKNTPYPYESLVHRLLLTHAGKSLEPVDVEREMASYLGESRFNRFLRSASRYRDGDRMDGNVRLLHRPNAMFFVSTGYETAVGGYYRLTEDGFSLANELKSNEGDMLVPLYSATMAKTFDEMTPEERAKFRLVHGNHLTMLLDPENLDKMVAFLGDRPVQQ